MKTLQKMCEISSSICSSPIGRLTISYCPNGLHGVSQVSNINDKSFKPDEKFIFVYFLFLNKNFFLFSQSIKIQSSTGLDPMPESCLNWLETYFHSPDELSRTPELCPEVVSKYKSFQENVWHKLLKNVPFGHTITYRQLAELAGNKNASRGVGSAMRRNPFQLIVPCHRVIRSNGVTGNYGGGERNNVKIWLLKHEHN